MPPPYLIAIGYKGKRVWTATVYVSNGRTLRARIRLSGPRRRVLLALRLRWLLGWSRPANMVDANGTD